MLFGSGRSRAKRSLLSNLLAGSSLRRLATPRGRSLQRRSSFELEALEPRLLLSGDPNGMLAHGVLTGALTAGNDEVVVALAGVAADGGQIINLKVNAAIETF